MMALQTSIADPEPARSFYAVTPCTASPAISDGQRGFHLDGEAGERGRATDVCEELRADVHSELRHAIMPHRPPSAITDWTPPNLARLKAAWTQGKWQSKFHLGPREVRMVSKHGLEAMRRACRDIVRRRISTLQGVVDGRQTPMRGHPVFLAQHATATCCRQCLFKWHHICHEGELSSKQEDWVVHVIMDWIQEKYKVGPPKNCRCKTCTVDKPHIKNDRGQKTLLDFCRPVT
mmetsp:Transcript_41220/g.129510  ORF Transcript_41220/g.129510 Transcript_41220/m.129510 type:complete len:234 (+) Transcript_41220:335-1036(+)